MKKLAKLIMFFCFSFLIIFAAATIFRFLALRVDWLKSLPPKPETTLTLILSAAHWALSLALFSSILISLNYTVRRTFNPLISIACIFFLSFFITSGVSLALNQWKAVPPSQVPSVSLGSRGLILSNSLNRNDTSVILLNGTTEPLGPRVVAIPDQPLTFHRTAGSDFSLPNIPFNDDNPWFLESLAIDIRLNAELFQRKFSESFFAYIIYVGSLIFMLCSIGYAVKFSVWPLANIFLATLAFRGILAFGTFFNSPEMQEIISAFLNNRLPVTLALPLMFLAFGMLVNVYSLLAYVSKRRYDDD